MKVVRQQDEPERQHPEAENRQKTQNAAKDQQHPNRQSGNARLRQRDTYGAQNEATGGVINAKALGGSFSRGIMCFSHRLEMGLYRANTSGCHFFEKTAWQIGQAFVLGHSRRRKR
ncbi:hypothetical protein FHT77_004590 [Rhizobium sp. BK181]|nr:hypothetical protein [Rhizobium sp. BK181]